MENWDPQMMLDLYLHNYFTKKNMHTTADIFAREANFHPRAVAIENPEGFLSEWWSIFWSIFSAKFPEHTVQENGTGPSNFNLTMPMSFPIPEGSSIQEIDNLLKSDNSKMTMSMPDNGDLIGNILSKTVRLRPESRNLLVSDLSRATMPRPEPGSDIRATNFNSPSSSNPRYQRERVYMNPQLCLRRNDNCGLSFRRPTAAAGPSKLSPIPHELKLKSPETDSRGPAKNMNFDSQLNDPSVRLVPSSVNFSRSPQEKVHTNPHQLSSKNVEKSGTRFCSLAAAEAARFPPRACPPGIEPAAAFTDTRRVCGPELFAINRSTQPLPSGSNFSSKKNKKQRQLAVTGVKIYSEGLKRSTAAEPPRAILPKIEPADESDARAFEQAHLGPPPGMELPLLPSSSSKHSPGQRNVSKNDKLPVAEEDKGCDPNMERATDAEPTHLAPKVTIQPKIEPAETGSYPSSNSGSSEPSSTMKRDVSC
ncbi:hypothetical protein CASFOL_040750 [Castilleja foliolosa]|uniref:LisH domain-containing protein n=1 Tax=Castilleja foliolosa TaxID=1961234 RepID=A0ABD3BCV5_9LAMI